MTLPLYLAMTAEEMAAVPTFPQHLAYMACHFAPYGIGLSNLPPSLPPRSLLILNDRLPPLGQDPLYISQQLQELCVTLQPEGLLLDFQRKNDPQLHSLVATIEKAPPCPVCVTTDYADGNNFSVLLELPPHRPLQDAISDWTGRSLWLDLAPSTTQLTVDAEGCHTLSLVASPKHLPFQDTRLCCHYQIQALDEALRFTLTRTPADLHALMAQAQQAGIRLAIGLYQQLKEEVEH